MKEKRLTIAISPAAVVVFVIADFSVAIASNKCVVSVAVFIVDVSVAIASNKCVVSVAVVVSKSADVAVGPDESLDEYISGVRGLVGYVEVSVESKCK